MSYGSRRCFATFLEQDGPPDAKTGDAGEQFRMSERQRVRGTVVDSCFCESRENLVSNTVMAPFIQKLLALDKPEFFTRKNLQILVYKKAGFTKSSSL